MAEFNPEFEISRSQNLREYLQELKQMKETLHWIWTDLINKEGKKAAKKVFVMICAVCLLGTFVGLVFKMLCDGLTEHDSAKVLIGLVTLFVVYRLQEAAQYFKRTVREGLLDFNTFTLNNVTNKLFFEKSMMQHISQSSLLNEANIKRGFERVQEIQTMFCFQATETALNIVIPYVFLWILDWRLGILITVIMVVHILWAMFLSYRVLKFCLPIERRWRFLGRYRSERWEKVERVKANAKVETEIDFMNDYYRETIRQDKGFWFWFIKQISFRAGAADTIFTLFLGYAAYKVWTGGATVGWLVTVFMWGSRVIDNFWSLSDIEHRINYLTPSVIALKKALTLPVKLRFNAKPVILDRNSPCRVEFQDVTYCFENANEPVLNNINLIIEPGRKVAIFGRSGIGKSTLMRLLMRYDDPTSGRITIDGTDLRDIDLDSWKSLIGYIPQDASIFSGTIKDNLVYGNSHSEMSDEELWHLVRMLEIDFGERLDKGLYTTVGRGGITLSGGQKQRLMIGAAAAKNPKFMLIDEATSALDSSTERKVQSGLQKVLGPGIGALIIAHRLSTVRRICDKFIMIDKRPDNQGSHIEGHADDFESLLRDCNAFRSLAHDQDIIHHTLR